MKLYELVAIIDPQLSQDDQQSLIAQIESMLPEGATIEQKDEIGLQKVYQFAATKAGVAYFVSWYISMQSSDIIPLKRKMTLLK
jgi:ribosomal protein S6